MKKFRNNLAGRQLNNRSRRRGSALIEFAMIAVLFFTMLLGMIQFGLYQSSTSTLWNLSREGARFASVYTHPSDADIEARIKAVAPPNIDKNKLVIYVLPKTTRVSGDPVSVTITYDLADKIIVPFIGAMLKKDRTYTATATQPALSLKNYEYMASSVMRAE